MAANVGGEACQFVRGTAPGLSRRTETWQIAGVSGYGAQTMGLGDAPFRFIAEQFDDDAAIDTWLANLEGKRGTAVTIVNDIGDSFTNRFIEGVRILVPKHARLDETGTKKYKMILEILGVKIKA